MVDKIGWIRRNKQRLLVIGAISIFICIAEIIYFRSVGKTPLESWQFAILILPWFVTFSVILALWHEGWFGEKRSGLIVTIQKIFYWIVVVVFCFIFASIIQRLIF